MNGVHDMGGLQGFGPLQREVDEPLFHAPWERRVFALALAMGATGQWNIDMSRRARESLPPAEYLASSYFQIWLGGLRALMLQRGLVSEEELAAGHKLQAGVPLARVLQAAQVSAALARGSPTARTGASAACFAVGERVRARNMHPSGHTRLPRYVRGHVGTVVKSHGAHIFADRHAQGNGPPFDEAPQWLYTVEFEAAELWGEHAEPGVRVSVDAWEPYLEAMVA